MVERIAGLNSNGSPAGFLVDDRHAVGVFANRWDPIVVGDAVLVIVDLEVQFPEGKDALFEQHIALLHGTVVDVFIAAQGAVLVEWRKGHLCIDDRVDAGDELVGQVDEGHLRWCIDDDRELRACHITGQVGVAHGEGDGVIAGLVVGMPGRWGVGEG